MWAIGELQNGAPSFAQAVFRLEIANSHALHADAGSLEMLDDAVAGLWKGNHCVLVTLQARRSVVAMRE